MAVILFCCKKKEILCPKMGYEFTYSKPGVSYLPSFDSILLGDQITLEAAVPKTFFDEQKQSSVTLQANTIFGPLSLAKATNNTSIPTIGAIEDAEFIALTGNIVKDSIHFSEEQLLGFRTTYWDGNNQDSFRLKISIRPKIRGIFFVSLGQQGNKDIECALYKYLLKISNSNQHLYFLAQAKNGFVSEYERNYAYCFKVY
jgi:hypothetical protein